MELQLGRGKGGSDSWMSLLENGSREHEDDSSYTLYLPTRERSSHKWCAQNTSKSLAIPSSVPLSYSSIPTKFDVASGTWLGIIEKRRPVFQQQASVSPCHAPFSPSQVQKKGYSAPYLRRHLDCLEFLGEPAKMKDYVAALLLCRNRRYLVQDVCQSCVQKDRCAGCYRLLQSQPYSEHYPLNSRGSRPVSAAVPVEFLRSISHRHSSTVYAIGYLYHFRNHAAKASPYPLLQPSVQSGRPRPDSEPTTPVGAGPVTAWLRFAVPIDHLPLHPSCAKAGFRKPPPRALPRYGSASRKDWYHTVDRFLPMTRICLSIQRVEAACTA